MNTTTTTTSQLAELFELGQKAVCVSVRCVFVCCVVRACLAMAAPSVVFVGLACVDFIAEVPRLPAEDTEVRATGMRQAVGGNSANSSRVAARLGLDARLFAPFGDASDPSGAFALKDLRAQGVRVVEDRIEAPIPTSFITVAANTGSRTIVSCKHPLYRNVSAAAFEKSLLAGELLPKCYIEGDVETDSGDAPGTSESETPAAWIHFEGRDGPDVAQCVQTARRICPGRSTTISLELEKLAEGREESLMAIVPDVDVTFISSEFARGLGCTSAAAAAKRVCSRMRDGRDNVFVSLTHPPNM